MVFFSGTQESCVFKLSTSIIINENANLAIVNIYIVPSCIYQIYMVT